ncbi:MAG: Ig-like domain repeat protein, partial [Chloroflexi bacterium]|nr:Ig-like domain repeat protein [Chloroflexota bacterium]
GAYEAAVVDLAIAKSVAPASVAPGRVVTFTLVFSNAGSLPAAGVVITDLIPSQINPATLAVLSSGVSIAPVNGVTYAWQAQDMASGARGVITITGNVRTDLATLPQTITNTAVITMALADGNHSNNSASAQATLARASTTVALVSAPNPSILSQAAGFTATVTGGIPGVIIPTGSVTLTIDTTAIVLPLNPSGKASYVTSTLALGTHAVTAAYRGDNTFGPSSATLPGGHVVNDIPITALTAANSSPTLVHHATAFTATANGTNIVFQWNFGDGTALQVGNPVIHTYATYGTYTAVLTATNTGSVSTKQTSVRIEPYRTFVPMLRR